VLGGGDWLIGRDTRASGPSLVAALADGLTSAGADVVDLGVLPTPAVAFHSALADVPAAVVSASHNPWTDNGIKLLGAGRKLSDSVEAAIASRMDGPFAGGSAVGTVRAHPDPLADYAAHLVGTLGGRRLDGLVVVVDCANGAASDVAPSVLRSLGASVSVLAAAPDGTNINADCGSNHPAALQAAVVAGGASAGLAFDGDADRVIAVAGDGTIVDGDSLIAICGADLDARSLLRDHRVAVTVMSNLGLRRALADLGIDVVETAVGDRYVLEAMERDNLSLGGEQSGHVIFRDLATTGDGLLTGLQLLDVVVRSGQSLASLAASAMIRLPQVLRAVRVADRDALAGSATVQTAVEAATASLGGAGRVVLRPSGTEPLVRVMVEAVTEAEAVAVADRLVAVVTEALGSA